MAPGGKFARAILADWGHKEVEDLLAGVDWAVSAGLADPGRLGIGGWSYGGLLIDYTIASDPRFQAAISAAGSGNQTGGSGRSPAVAQLAQLQEHGARLGTLTDLRERLP